MKKIAVTISLLLLLTSCAFAPLNGPKTARSLEAGHVEGDLNLIVPGVSLDIGITKDLDIDLAYETQIFSVYSAALKYSLYNNPEGFSLALWGGAFQGIDLADSHGYFGGPVMSYRSGWFETYFRGSYNYVYWNGTTLEDDDDNGWLGDIVIEDTSFFYYQLAGGFNFWFSENVGMNLSAYYLFFPHSEVKGSIIPNLSFMFTF